VPFGVTPVWLLGNGLAIEVRGRRNAMALASGRKVHFGRFPRGKSAAAGVGFGLETCDRYYLVGLGACSGQLLRWFG
jgi:hypothetical protein